MTLTWDDAQDDAIAGYVILRRDRAIHPMGTFVTIADDTGSADTTYTDDTVEPDKQYVYRIQAINEHGGTSERSHWLRADIPAVPQPDSPATGQPTISGTAQVGETLTVDTTGIGDADGLTNVSYSYQWIRNDLTSGTDIAITSSADITDATDSTYTLVAADEGKTIKVRVSFTDDADNEETLTSAPTAMVAARPNQPATGAPAIDGAIQVGETLTADTTGIADADGLSGATYSYQWIRNDGSTDTDIQHATEASYTLVESDEGQTIKVKVSFADDADNRETLSSTATATVAARPNTPATGAPTISGTAQAGETLAVDTSNISDGDGMVNFSYQWISNDGATDTDITDETSSTYTIKPWDLGKHIKARVSFTDGAGTKETLTSVATMAVEASPNVPPTDVLLLSGMAEVGQSLNVYVGYIWDENGMNHATFSYQWIRNDGTTDTDITDATGSSYTLVDADEGESIKVRVSFTDDGANAETLTSSATTAVTARPDTTDLSAPTALSVDWSGGEENGNDLEWMAPEGTVTGYQILRLEIPTRSFSWEPYAYGCTPLMEVHVSDTGGDATTYTDTDVAESASYLYSVRAIDSDGVGRKSSSTRLLQYRPPHAYSPSGVPSSYWPSGALGTPHQAPTNLASSQIKNGIGLTWDAPEGTWDVPGREVTGYQILRRRPEQCDFGYRVYVENTNSTDTHWADRNVVAGTRYEYHVRAVNDVGAGRLDRSISTSLRPTALVVGPDPNNPATGTPAITGTAQVGETLTADPSGIADVDGLYWASFNYQWLSSWDTEIEGATSSTYTLQASDANKVIKVRIDFMDDSGYEESPTSAATGAVTSNVPATGAPAITGTAEIGETLTADTSGIVDSDGLDNVSFSYQWIRSDPKGYFSNNAILSDWNPLNRYDYLDIDGATSATYTLTATDVGHTIKVRVSYTDDMGSGESLASAATVTVPIEVAFTFSIEGTTVNCDSWNVHVVNRPYEECDDPISTDQGANGEIDVEIEIARSVSSQLYKFDFGIYQVEDSLGHYSTVEANDLCLGPGLAESALLEVTPEDGTGPFTYTDDGTIFGLCDAGTFQLLVRWYRYDYTDQEYEPAGTFRRYFFITSNEEVDTSIEKVKWIRALYPDPPVSHDEVQIQGTKKSEVLNRELATFSLSIGGLVPDSDPETTDYVVRLRVTGENGPYEEVPWCHVGNVGYSYPLKTVPEDGRWVMDAHVLGSCIRAQWPDTLQVELFDGSDLTDYSEPLEFDGSHILSYTGELLYPESGTYRFIAFKDIVFRPQPTIPEPTIPEPAIPEIRGPTISGTAQVGETLTVDTSGMVGPDGEYNVSFSYQWIAIDGTTKTNIVGATDSTYTLVADDAGKTIIVWVARSSLTDGVDHIWIDYSTATEVVTVAVPQQTANNPATGSAAISGTAQVGETLTVDTSGIADDDGLDNATFSYQWIANDGTSDTDITGATDSTYTLVVAEEGKTIKVKVSFTDDAGNEETLTSSETSKVAAAAPTEPPRIPRNLTGTANADGTVTLRWDTPDDDSVTGYQIMRRSPTQGEKKLLVYVNDTGTAATEYTDSNVVPDELYAYRVKAINPAGLSIRSEFTSVTPTQPAEPAQNSPATGTPTISGILQVGETLTANTTGIADADGLTNVTYRYQWIPDDGSFDADNQDPPSSSYTLFEADEGKIIKLEVSFTDDAGNAESLTSAATAAVAARPNTPATGAPTISGTSQVPETLTANTSDIVDDDGLTNVAYNYQWITYDGSSDTDIAGETGITYTLVDTDEGKTVKVQVAFTDDAGNDESLTSAATAAVAARPNTPARGAPTISGTSQVPETLTANTSDIVDDDGLTNVAYSYQWITNDGSSDTDIAGETGMTYTLVDTDEGKTVKVQVAFTDDADNDESLTSQATARVAAAAPTKPPRIPRNLTGAANADGTVTLTWDAPNNHSVTGYQILRRSPTLGEKKLLVYVNDTGSTATEYTDSNVVPDEVYAYRVKAINAVGLSRQSEFTSVTPTQPAEPAQNSPATGTPIISGTLQVGEILTANTTGIADADGLTNVTFSYQWLSDDADIAGATASTYPLVSDDEGKTLKVRVRFADDVGNDESLTSAATAAVAAEDPQSQELPAKPTGLTGTVSMVSVSLSWDDPGDGSITGYQVLRRDKALHEIGEFLVHVEDTGSASPEYVEEDVAPGARYVYRIKARNASGLSEQSESFDADTTPDFVAVSPSVSDSDPDAGATFTLSATVRNDGASGWSSTLNYYLSSGSTITRSDTFLHQDTVGWLAASGSSDHSIDLTAPSTDGIYYYGACASEDFYESDMTNNCSTAVLVRVGDQPLARVDVTPDEANLTALSDTATLAAKVFDEQGDETVGATVTWSSSNTEVATVSTAGVVTAVANGSATITATASSGLTVTAAVTVRQRAASVEIDPGTVEFTSVGDTATLTARMLDANGHEMSPTSWNWSSADDTVAIADSHFTSMVPKASVRAIGHGTTTVSLRAGGGGGYLSVTVTVTVTVSGPRVEVSPVKLTFTALGDSATATVRILDENGDEDTDATYRWISISSTGAFAIKTVDGGLEVTAEGTGSGWMEITSEGATSAILLVTVYQEPKFLTVSPSSTSLAVGETATLTATITDANGHSIAVASGNQGGKVVFWETSDSEVATIDGDDDRGEGERGATVTATAVKAGTPTITASWAREISGTATVTVTDSN